MTRAWQKVAKAEGNFVLGVLGFNKAAAEVLENNNLSDITSLINTRRPTYDALARADREIFSTTDVEQLEAFLDKSIKECS